MGGLLLLALGLAGAGGLAYAPLPRPITLPGMEAPAPPQSEPATPYKPLEGMVDPVRVLLYQGAQPGKVRLVEASSPSFCPPPPAAGENTLWLDTQRLESGEFDLASKGGSYTLSASADSLLEWQGRPYRGALRLERTGGRMAIVNIVPLEDYLRGVVPEELLSNALEAVKAQAIVARTYAVTRRGQTEALWDLTATPSSQVYGGVAAEEEISDRAVQETQGLILTFADQAATQTLYHSSCGGATEGPPYVYGTPAVPYLQSVACDDGRGGSDCQASSYATWRAQWTGRQLGEILAKYWGKPTKSVERLEIAERGPSGRVSKLKVQLEGGEERLLEFEDIRQALQYQRPDGSWASLPSTKFEIVAAGKVDTDPQGSDSKGADVEQSSEPLGLPQPAPLLSLVGQPAEPAPAGQAGSQASQGEEAPALKEGEILLIGHGWGHGLGLCQWGAMGMARRGLDCLQILERYYPGTQVGRAADWAQP